MTRLDYGRLSPEGYRAMLALNKFAEESGLEHSLLELVKIRAIASGRRWRGPRP